MKRAPPWLAAAVGLLVAACSGSGGAEPAVTVPTSPPTTAAPAPAEPPAPVAEYLFPQNHPGRHGLAGRMRVEQLLSAGERTVAVVADTSFQPAVGFRCTVTVNVDGSQASVNGFVAVGDDYWLDTGLGWERVPPDVAPGDFEEVCGPGLPVFANPPAGSLVAGGDAREEALGATPALRVDLDPGRLGDERVLADVIRWVGLSEPEARRGTAWVVGERWLGRLEVAIAGARSGPLGAGMHDYELRVTFSDLGAGVTVAPPAGGA